MYFRFGVVLAIGLVLSTAGSATSDTPKDETPAQRRERLAITIQAICPVSGESLTDHAKPVKMVHPETKETLYVCCESCLKQKPDNKYLEKIRSHFAKAQGKCLVMSDNEITEKSKYGIVEGRFVYVCCPPCIKKMNADPEKYLAALDDLYEAALKQK